MQRKNVERKFTVTGFFSSYHFKWNLNFVFPGETHEMWEMVYVKFGSVEVVKNEKIVLLEKGQMIIYAPWEFHRIKSALGTKPEVYVISFYTDGTLPPKLKEGFYTLKSKQAQLFTNICVDVMTFLNQNDSSVYFGQELADRLSAFLISLGDENVKMFDYKSHSAKEYQKLIVAMTEGIADNKTLSEIAQECAISVSYAKYLFLKYAGMSPKAYYNNLRILEAARLLDSDVSVSNVAEILNFSSSNYFSSFFKNHTGLSPIDYKSGKKKDFILKNRSVKSKD